MTYNNKVEKDIREQLNQRPKTQFSLLVKATKFEFPIQCNLLEKILFPIMLYSCEILGTQHQDLLDIILLEDLKQSTHSYMVYGES